MTGIRLRHVAQVNPVTPEFDLLADDEIVTFLPLEAVWPGARIDVSRNRPKGEVSNGYTRFREGDVLVPKITPTFEANRSTIARGLRHYIGAGTTELHVVRPKSNLDVRYANYLLSSRSFLQGGKAAMKGVAGQQRVPDEWLLDFHVPVAEAERQRMIADYLDAETTRIDALREKKRCMITLLNERDSRMIDECFAPRSGETLVRLARFAEVRTGITLHEGRELDGDSLHCPYLRVANVQPGWLDLSEVKSVTVPKAMAERSRLRAGDVLMTEGGDIDKLGRGTVWREEIEDCLHQNHVFAVRPDAHFLDSEYLGYLTRTSHARAYFEMTGSQSINLASTSASKVSDFKIPALSIGEQRDRVQQYQEFAAKNQRMSAALTEQLDLITEHRQALITAAVTGQLQIPGAYHETGRTRI